MQKAKYFNEGDRCPNFGPNCCGRLELKPTVNCSCHINPPCSACVDNNTLKCEDCGHEVEMSE